MSKDKSHLFDPEKHEIVYKEAKSGVSSDQRRKHEAKKIAQHNPSWNDDRGGSGRKRSQSAVRSGKPNKRS